MKRLPKAIVIGCIFVLAQFDMGDPANSQPTSHYERPVGGNDSHKDRVIVFVHGIFGDAKSTWTSPNGAYFPRLLLYDKAFDDFDIYVANYESPAVGNRMTVDEVATNLNSRLTADEVFTKHRQVIFVCHSLGGIVVPQLLLTFRGNGSKVPPTYFLSEPAKGSPIATPRKWFSAHPL